jgi:murein DD-endopeptidase MepM/ murein hydrolase activator NlpD
VAKVSQILGEQLFPERRLLLQSSSGVHHVALPGWLQAMLLAASLATIGAVAYLCVGFMHLRDTLDSRVADTTPAVTPTVAQTQPPRLAVAPAATTPASTNPPGQPTDTAALDEMRGEIATLHQQIATLNQNYAQATANYQQASDKLTALTQQNNQLQAQLADATTRSKSLQEARDEAEHRAKTSEQALNSKNGNSEQLTKNLDAARNELQQSEVQRTTLQNRVQQLQIDLQSAQARADQADARTQQLASDPQRTAPAAAPALVQPITPEAAPPERKPAPNGVPHAQNNSGQSSSELERLLASTGLDIDRLLHGLGNSSGGEGGPYIALDDPRAAALDHQRLDELKKLAKILPLASPLVGPYQLGSDYGARIDPINHKESFHPGLDLDAPYRTTVYSTGAGTVIFTGNMDSYGRVVEIDHGHGIVTRYAHLHRILVAKGQKVGLHSPIAELGSTGRSTGPHLHYEVRVDGQTVDPAKFMQAGKNVVQVSGQQ